MTMPARHQHSGERALARRQVKCTSDMMLGTALEKNLLHAVAIALQFANRPGIQRRAFGKAIDLTQEKIDARLLPFLAISDTLQAIDSITALVTEPIELALKICFELLACRHRIENP